VDPTERPSLTIARDSLAAVAEGRPAPVLDAASAPTNRIAGSRMPPAPPPNTPPPWNPPKDATRLDVHPFTEPAPSGPGQAAPFHREPVPSGPIVRPAPPRPQRAGGSRARSVALTVLAIVAAMLVGILVATLLAAAQDKSAGGNPGGKSSQQAAPPPDTPTAEEPTEDQDDSPSGEDYEQAVRDYYALLPGRTDQAFDLLTDRAQRKSGGKKTYTKFWNTIESVQVERTESNGDRVAATLLYEIRNGKQSRETTSFALVEEDGQILIDNFKRLGAGGIG
jgi:hypothetical protein